MFLFTMERFLNGAKKTMLFLPDSQFEGPLDASTGSSPRPTKESHIYTGVSLNGGTPKWMVYYL
jgi:hypothetical protein